MYNPHGSDRRLSIQKVAEAREIMRNAILVPFPARLLDRPIQTEAERLDLLLSGLDDRNEQIRANIKRQFHAIHPSSNNKSSTKSPKPPARSSSGDEVLAASRIEAENRAVIASLRKQYDPKSGDPAVKSRPTKADSGSASQAEDPALTRLLDDYDRHARDIRVGYEQRLAKLRQQPRPAPPPFNPPTGPRASMSIPTTPTTPAPGPPGVPLDPRLRRKAGVPPSLSIRTDRTPLESGEITPAISKSASLVPPPGSTVRSRDPRLNLPLRSSPEPWSRRSNTLPPRPATAAAVTADGQSPTKPIWAQAAKRKPSSELTRSSDFGDAKRRNVEIGSGAGATVGNAVGVGSGGVQQGLARSSSAVGVGRASEPQITPGARGDGRDGRGGGGGGASHPSSPMNSVAVGRGNGGGRGGAEDVIDPYKDPRRQRRGY